MVKILVRYWLSIRSLCVYTYSHQCYASGRIVDRATLQFKLNCDMRLNIWMSKVIVTVKKMSGQVRWKARFIKNKTLDYEVRRNSGLVEARKRKYSTGHFTYASKLVLCVCVCVCVETYSGQAKGNSVAGSRYCYVYLFESD